MDNTSKRLGIAWGDRDPNATVVGRMLQIDRELQLAEKFLETAEATLDDALLCSDKISSDESIERTMVRKVIDAAKKGQRLLKRRNRLIDWYDHLSDHKLFDEEVYQSPSYQITKKKPS